MRRLLSGAAIAAAGAAAAVATEYERSETFMGQDFFEPFRWSFHTAEDPTHGTVDYVNYSTAAISGLVNASSDRIYMGADSKTVIRKASRLEGRGLRGRPSVRIMSRESFNGGLFVLSLDHMPTGCGVWPAFWMYGEDEDHIWPTWGEFDIIEGVHLANRTMTTLHTTGGCDQSKIQGGKQFTGKWLQGLDRKADNCDVGAKGQWGNQGCSQAGPEASMGAPFNKNGGGTFAAEWDPEGGHFRAWFWPASAGVPPDVTAHRPKPDTWGRPYSYFEISDDDCGKDHFKNMKLVFDVTFCGDLGAPTFASGCPEVAKKMTCEEFVERHPEEFKEAYWSIRGLDIYKAKSKSQVGLDNVEAPRRRRQWPDVFGRFVHPAEAETQTTSIAPVPTTSTLMATPAPVPQAHAEPTIASDAAAEATRPSPALPDIAATAARPRDEAAFGTNEAAFGEALPPERASEDANDPWGTHFDPVLWRSEAAARASAEAEEDFALGKSEHVSSGMAHKPLPPEAQQFVKPEYLHNVQMKTGSTHPDTAGKPVDRTLVWVSSCLVVCGLTLAAGLWRSRLWGARSSRAGGVGVSAGGSGPQHLKYRELRGGLASIPSGEPEHVSAEAEP